MCFLKSGFKENCIHQFIGSLIKVYRSKLKHCDILIKWKACDFLVDRKNEETPAISRCLILLSLSSKVPLGKWGVLNQTMEEPIQEHQIMGVSLDHHLHQNA